MPPFQLKPKPRPQSKPTPRKAESGYALLFVLAMASAVAIGLYMEVPRVAFEAQRDKEQLLIDRGEQYTRAIQLYVRKFNRYPPDFEALNNTQNIRFLRNKYKDPLTGKDDWRIIHVGPGGVFTDSLLYNKKTTDQAPEKQTFINELQSIGTQADATQQVNLATRKRESDQPNAPGNATAIVGGAPGSNPDGSIPGAALNGTMPGALPAFAQGSFQIGPNGQPIPVPAGTAPQSLQLPPGMQLPPGVTLPPGVQLAPGSPQAAPPASAANLINQLLTSPRPGGLNGVTGSDSFGSPLPNAPASGPGTGVGVTLGAVSGGLPAPQVQTQAGPATIGGGIAGIASKVEQDGIKVYRDRQSYHEWEFVYDITKDTSRTGAVPTTPAPANVNGNAQTGSSASAFGAAAPAAFTPPPTPPPAPATPAQ